VKTSRHHAGGLLVEFDAVTTRDEAEEWRGTLLFVQSDELPEPSEGSWWEGEVVGMRVVDKEGTTLGEVTNVITAPKQDLWEVTTATGVVQVPAVDEIVKSVDTAARLITLDPPAGLFE
jgi:16S rRNA processing protein RimM